MKKTVNQKSSQMTCAIVGARGYTGLETARLLLKHPNAQLTACFATANFRLPFSAPNVECLGNAEIMNHLADVMFLATPAEVSLELAPKLVSAGKRVIDLSGAFRLKHNDYSKWYGFEHSEATSLQAATYGLVPWVGPSRGEALIANPGCYATAISMALVPLLRAGVIETEGLVIDAKSGATGAGKKAVENLLFTEVEGECLPYRVGRHQHTPEIIETVAALSGCTIDPHFTTSLLPVRRGIIAGIYGRTHVGEREIAKAFADAYAGYELVEFGSIDQEPALATLKSVVGTAKTRISFRVEGSKLYLFSCIDNLMKGAASQAVENFNRICDLPLATGLGHLEALI